MLCICILKENPLYWEGELGENLMARTVEIGYQEFEHVKIEIRSYAHNITDRGREIIWRMDISMWKRF